jgi:hypothetical protein
MAELFRKAANSNETIHPIAISKTPPEPKSR